MTIEQTNIIYINTYYKSQKQANQKYYEANKLKISEKRKEKLLALKQQPELYEQHLLKNRLIGNRIYHQKKERQKQQQE